MITIQAARGLMRNNFSEFGLIFCHISKTKIQFCRKNIPAEIFLILYNDFYVMIIEFFVIKLYQEESETTEGFCFTPLS